MNRSGALAVVCHRDHQVGPRQEARVQPAASVVYLLHCELASEGQAVNDKRHAVDLVGQSRTVLECTSDFGPQDCGAAQCMADC